MEDKFIKNAMYFERTNKSKILFKTPTCSRAPVQIIQFIHIFIFLLPFTISGQSASNPQSTPQQPNIQWTWLVLKIYQVMIVWY